MWMKELANGKFKYSERYIEPYTEKAKQVSITLNSSSRQAQNEALRKLNGKIDSIIKKSDYTQQNITVGDVIEEWQIQYKEQVKSSSYYTSQQILVTISKHLKSDILIRNIDSVLLVTILENLLYGESKLSNGYVRKIKSRLNQILKFSMKKGYILSNPMDLVEISFKKESHINTRKLFLEDEEYHEIINLTDIHNKRYSLLFQWLYYNGFRAGEALAMKHSDVTIDYDNDIFKAVVSGTLEYHGIKISNQQKSDSAKTISSMREIDLSKNAVNVYYEAVKINEGIDSEYIFCTSKGTPIQITAINTYLRKYIKPKIDIDKDISSHIFRHTHVSKLAELNVPLYAIQDRIGHEGGKITEKIYLHVTNNVKQQLKSKIDLI